MIVLLADCHGWVHPRNDIRGLLKIVFVVRLSEKVNGENKTRKIPEPYLP